MCARMHVCVWLYEAILLYSLYTHYKPLITERRDAFLIYHDLHFKTGSLT